MLMVGRGSAGLPCSDSSARVPSRHWQRPASYLILQ